MHKKTQIKLFHAGLKITCKRANIPKPTVTYATQSIGKVRGTSKGETYAIPTRSANKQRAEDANTANTKCVAMSVNTDIQLKLKSMQL